MRVLKVKRDKPLLRMLEPLANSLGFVIWDLLNVKIFFFKEDCREKEETEVDIDNCTIVQQELKNYMIEDVDPNKAVAKICVGDIFYEYKSPNFFCIRRNEKKGKTLTLHCEAMIVAQCSNCGSLHLSDKNKTIINDYDCCSRGGDPFSNITLDLSYAE